MTKVTNTDKLKQYQMNGMVTNSNFKEEHSIIVIVNIYNEYRG